MLHIEPFAARDGAATEALLDRAFGPGRLSKTSYAFRHGIAPIADLRFVAHGADDADGGPLGTIACWPIMIGAAGTPALLLGPVRSEEHTSELPSLMRISY